MMNLFITMLVSQNLFAEALGSPQDDGISRGIQTADGGYVLTGWTRSSGYGGQDILVMRIGPAGNIVWARAFGGSQDEWGSRIIQTSDGGYAIVGTTRSFGAGVWDCFVMKLNSNGEPVWAKTYGDYQTEWGESLVQTTDGGYAIAGFTYSSGYGLHDALIMKLDPSGNLTWAKTYGGWNEDGSWSIIQSPDEDETYMILGSADSFGAGSRDLFLLKLSPVGTFIWGSTYGGSGHEDTRSFVQSGDGGYVVSGWTTSFGTGGDFLVFKVNAGGGLVWARTIGGAQGDTCHSIIRTQDNGFVISGWTRSFGSLGRDLMCAKVSSDGNLEWAGRLSGNSDDLSGSAIPTSDGGVMVLGDTRSYGNGSQVLLLKLASTGAYENCLIPVNATTISPSLSVTTLSSGYLLTPYIVVGNPNFQTTTLNFSVSNICDPLYEGVFDGGGDCDKGFSCRTVPRGVLFIAHVPMPVSIYSPEGRLVYSRELQKGENWIELEHGVYFWRASSYMGKAVVR